MKAARIPLVMKIVVLQVAFLLLHYLYTWFPNGATALISATNESIYQHMKIAFFAYILVSLLEYALVYKRIQNPGKYVHARIFTAILLSWLVFAWYYTASAYFGRIQNIVIDILFANIAFAITSLSGLIVEQNMEKVEFSLGLKWLGMILFLVILSEYLIFTHHLPWADVFALPPGW